MSKARDRSFSSGSTFQPVDEAQISIRLGLEELTSAAFTSRAIAEHEAACRTLENISKSANLHIHAALVELPKIHFLVRLQCNSHICI